MNLGALHAEFTELTVRFEADHGALWCMFNHTERPCFTLRLLDQIRSLQTRIEQGLAGSSDAAQMPLRSVIWTSAVPGIWNLGGDLALFTRLICDGAEAELRRYAYTCVDAVYHNLTKGNLPFLTIAMVHGDALGGGFETVLSCDVVSPSAAPSLVCRRSCSTCSPGWARTACCAGGSTAPGRRS